MGIASEYLETEDLLIVVWHGPITAGDWNGFVSRQLAADPRWPIGTRRLADITTSDPSELTPADIDTVIGSYRDRLVNLVGSRQAIVASLGWDLARTFQRNLDRLGPTTVVFDHLDDACAWLGIDLTSTRQIITTLRAGLRNP